MIDEHAVAWYAKQDLTEAVNVAELVYHRLRLRDLNGAQQVWRAECAPLLIDAERGQLADSRDMPWYVSALRLSQPLHFGDYGGLPLKIAWALLDGLGIIVLVSGMYLWWSRGQIPLEARLEGVGVRETISSEAAP